MNSKDLLNSSKTMDVCLSGTVNEVIMLFMVGIERPQDNNTAWGIIVPVFEELGYGCVSAADEQGEVLYRAKEVILLMAEEVIANGHMLSTLNTGFVDYRAEYPAFTEWLAIEVPVEGLKGKQNVSTSPYLNHF
ncbi:type II toxin-antitoxin system HicB family antitoxin [Marinomonas rhodophyticola]|uniref:Type II toxin-antitoxin system HicB family antitoxin n=1 Tax=Marinomonas rhodophyticola TaxID=2992803 RepID=A0ABT3KKB3_9GAMM|nr:type II toxin-antitoxin system HicB family antitoxin [Marinomonas sp. KJ51-3]MCW4630975.1 type II toxin-antitoxin system HicB family antitoxin [Marinomonas sp. KJ51-3]